VTRRETLTAGRPRVVRRLPLALAGIVVLLAGAATGCAGPHGRPAATVPAAQAPAPAPGWRAAAHLDYSAGGEDPTSVSCPSARFCMAVLASGYAARYDGTRWSRPIRLPAAVSEPDSVSCPAASFCMAVGAQGSATLRFDGRTWRQGPRIPDAGSGLGGMASVSCPKPAFCAAVDNGANAFTFNGTAWSPATAIAPGRELSTVSCPSASFCAAVDYGPDVVTFDGSSWSRPSAIDPGSYLQAVSCAAATFCVAIDRKGNAFTFDGSTWSGPVNADPNGLSMGEGGISWPVVSCPGRDFCAAVDGGTGNVVTFDGSTWTEPVTLDAKAARSVSQPVLIFLMSVSCPSAGFCAAGDTHGDAFIRG
jgi:hypothetical protein